MPALVSSTASAAILAVVTAFPAIIAASTSMLGCRNTRSSVIVTAPPVVIDAWASEISHSVLSVCVRLGAPPPSVPANR